MEQEENNLQHVLIKMENEDDEVLNGFFNSADKEPTNEIYNFKIKCEEIDSETPLKIHSNKRLTKEKPYKCNQCEFASNQNCYLNRHKIIHTKEKPYKCDQCEFACSQNGNLMRHKLKHTKEKPYKCNQCEFAWAQNVHLKRHKMTHTKEKPQ